jgi:predicted RNA-binding Zn ribbon-like protein
VDQQASLTTEDPVGQRFLFLGGHVTLDLVNTVVVESGELVDRIASPEELAAWVVASSLGPEFGNPSVIDPAVYAQVIGLRGALKAGFDALVAHDPVPSATLATINAILRAAPGSELRRSGAGVRHVLRVDLGTDARTLPWLLADAAATLIASDQTGLLRRCANCDTCVLMFLDSSRSHTRRWCSMELCGNRNKVAAHTARARRRRLDTP